MSSRKPSWRLAGKIWEFSYDPKRGRFKGWLLQITQWRIADQFRRRQRAGRRAPLSGHSLTNLAENVPDPAAAARFSEIWDAEWRTNLLEAAQDRVRQRVAPRTFQAFELTVQKGWTVGRTAQALGVSQAQVYLAKHRVAAALKKEIKKLREQTT